MARVLLISYAGPPAMISSLYPDNGLASLAGVLAAAGHEARVLDLNTVGTLARLVPAARSRELAALLPAVASGDSSPELLSQVGEVRVAFEADLERLVGELAEELVELVATWHPSLVGFKLWSGDGFLASARMATRLRVAMPDVRIVGGGPAVLYSEHALFDLCHAFDALVDGEGEVAVVELARWADGEHALAEVHNLLLPGGGRTARAALPELDALPPGEYGPDVYPSLVGDQHIKVVVLDESRGCPMGCAFCVHQDASGGRWRVRSPENVVAQMADLSRMLGTRSFRLGGSYTPEHFYRRLSPLLPGESDGVSFSGFGHPHGLPREHLVELARRGCRALFLGVESLDSADLERLGKRLDPVRALDAARACLDAGIAPVISMIVPTPGQSAAARDRNLSQLVGLCAGREASVGVQFPGLLPRTRWWTERAQHGFALGIDELAYRHQLATYRIRHLLPPILWEPLPYTLDGRDFRGYASLAGEFQRRLTSAGVIVNLSDDMILLARAMGMDLAGFHRLARGLFFTLEASELQGLTRTLNHAISRPAAGERTGA